MVHIFKKKEKPASVEAEEEKVKKLQGELIDVSVKESEKRRAEELRKEERSLKSQLGRAKFLARHPSIQKLGSGAKEFGRFVVKEEIPAMRKGVAETSKFVSKDFLPTMGKVWGVSGKVKSDEQMARELGIHEHKLPSDREIRKELRDM